MKGIAAILLILIVQGLSSEVYSQISSFPYSEDFETGLGSWSQGSGDNGDWTRDSGGTPSANTGPNSGSGDTWYLFIEASTTGVSYPFQTAYLEATFDFTGEFNPTLSFDYHMHGADMGTIYVDVNDGSWNHGVWSISGQQQVNQGDAYLTALVDLSAYENRDNITVRFRAVTGDFWRGDMAIDNVGVCTVNAGTAAITSNMDCTGSATETLTLTGYDAGTIQWQNSTDNITFSDAGLGATDSESTGALSSSNTYYYRAAVTSGGCTAYSNVVYITVEAASSSNNTFPYSESFETDFGIWTNATGDDFDWTRDSGGTPTGSTGPDVANDGSFYLFIESNNNYNESAYLEANFDFSSLDSPELTFFYHMYGEDMGSLSVDVAGDVDVWKISGQQNTSEVDTWNSKTLDLSAYAGRCNVTIRFHGFGGIWTLSDMAIDDISIRDACKSVNGGTASISSTTMCSAGTVDLSLVGQDGGATLDWEQSTDNITFSSISETTPNATTGTLSVGNTYYYRCAVTNVCTAYSDTVSVVVSSGSGTSPVAYTEDFEAGLGAWAQNASDDMDWTANTGTTTSGNTGPSAGNGGAGQYYYTEASNPNFPVKKAIIENDFDFTGITGGVMTFYYHMYGSDMGSLTLQANNTTVWSISGEQQSADTDAWKMASVDLAAFDNECNVELKFVGETGIDFRSDMAIDDLAICTVAPGNASISDNTLCAAGPVTISLTDYDESATIDWEQSTDNITFSSLAISTNSHTTGTLAAGSTYYYRAAVTNGCTNYSDTVSVVVSNGGGESTFPYSEGFESGLGIWTNSTNDDFDWTNDSGGTPSGSTGPSTGNESTFYMFTEADGNNPDQRAILEANFDFTSASSPKLTFYYHMYGANTGTLYLDVNGTNLWSKSAEQQIRNTDPYLSETIDLSSYGGQCNTLIQFRVVTGPGNLGDIAIDDISICSKPETSVISGDTDVCSGDTGDAYSVTNNAGNTYAWFISGGSANPSSTTNSVSVDWGSVGVAGSVGVRETSGQCQGDIEYLNVNVHTLPTSTISGEVSLPVSSQDEVYSVDNNTGYTYAWTINGGSADPASTSNSVNIDWDGTAETVSLSVIATDAGRGCSAASSVSLNVTKYNIITSIATGNWNSTSTWDCTCIPAAGENVRILNTHVVTLAQNETINNIIIDAGGEVANSTFTLTVNGNYTNNGTHSGTGNIDLAGTDTQIAGSGSITTSGDLQISGGNKTIPVGASITKTVGNIDMTAGSLTVTNNGTITISSGNLNALNGTDTWTNTSTSSLSVNGSILSSGALDVSASGNTVTYGVAGAQNIKIPNGSQYYNLVLTNSGDKDLTGNIIVQNDLTISGAATLDATTSNYNIDIYGNWTNSSSGGFNPNSGKVNFVGTSGDQTISNTSDETFYDMTVNKSSGGISLAASTNIVITNSMTLTTGVITPASTETVTFNSGATATSTTSSYINGKVVKIGSDDFIFPIGKGKRGRLGISGVTSSTFEAEYFNSAPANRDNLTGLDHVSLLEYWDLDRTSGTGSISVTLYWDSGSTSGGSAIQDVSGGDLVVGHYTGGNWTNAGGTISGTASSGSVTGTASSFSPFTFASVSGDNTLPVDLLYFKGDLKGDAVELEWMTVSELNNDYFEIERSVDGIHYEKIGEIAGYGTTNEPQTYTYLDESPYYGVSYYRLTQVDYDGQFEVFPAVKVDNDQLRSGIESTLFPNPTDPNHMFVRVDSGDENSPIHVKIFDLMGHLVYNHYFEPHLGSTNYEIRRQQDMTRGVYTVVVQQADHIRNHKLVIR